MSVGERDGGTEGGEERERGQRKMRLMECVPTHQLSFARLWGSREGSEGCGRMRNEYMHPRNNFIKSISPPTLCCSLALPVNNTHLPPNVPACGGNWLRRGSTLELNGRFRVSKPRRYE